MEQIDKLIELIDVELETHDPGTDEWATLLKQRRKLVEQRGMLSEQNSKKRRVTPDEIIKCATALLQIGLLAAVSWGFSVDKEAIRFIRKP